MKILLIGSNGQLGNCLKQKLNGFDIYQTNRKELNLEDNEDQIIKSLKNISPDLIINTAAYTKVDKAEEDREIAYKINAKSINYISKFANERNIYLIHYSTDYVFDGQKNCPYFENDQTNPLTITVKQN